MTIFDEWIGGNFFAAVLELYSSQCISGVPEMLFFFYLVAVMAKEKTDELSDIAQIIDHEFRKFDNYLTETNSVFGGQVKEVKGHIDELKRSMSLLERDSGDNLSLDPVAFEKWETFHTDIYMYELELTALTDVSNVFAHSAFTFVASIFETCLKRVCSVFVEQHKIGPEHLRGSSFMLRAQMFLSRVAEVKLEDPGVWQQLRKFVELRNSIVHENGFVKRIAEKTPEGQSDTFKAVRAFKDYLKISEEPDGLTFTIEDISLVRNFANEAKNVLDLVVESSMERAKAL